MATKLVINVFIHINHVLKLSYLLFHPCVNFICIHIKMHSAIFELSDCCVLHARFYSTTTKKDTWFFQWYKLSSENRFYHQKVLSVSTKSNMRNCNKFGSKHRFTCFVICSNSSQTSRIKFITVINKNYGLFLLWFWWNSAVHLSLQSFGILCDLFFGIIVDAISKFIDTVGNENRSLCLTTSLNIETEWNNLWKP